MTTFHLKLNKSNYYLDNNQKYLREIKDLKFKMCVRFMSSFLDNLAKDFKKDSRIDRRGLANNRSYGNDYLIRKEEYGKIINLKKAS